MQQYGEYKDRNALHDEGTAINSTCRKTEEDKPHPHLPDNPSIRMII